MSRNNKPTVAATPPRANRRVLPELLKLEVNTKYFLANVRRQNAYKYIRPAKLRRPDWEFTTRAVEGGSEIWRVA
jgi:hypothetical protein